MLRKTIWMGCQRAVRGWRLLIPLALVSIGLGLLSLWPMYGALGAAALQRPFVRQLATRLDSVTLAQLITSTDPAQVGVLAGLWFVGLLGLVLLNGLAYNFFAGGILSRYAERDSFWAGSRRFFWTFTGLGLLAVVIFALLASSTMIIAPQIGVGLTTITIIIVLIAQVLNVVFEYARAVAVAHDLRGPWRALHGAISFCRRQWLGVIGLVLLANGLLVVWITLYVLVAGVLQPLALVAGALLWQQLFVVGQQWIKLLRLAWAITYVQQSSSFDAGLPNLPRASDDLVPSGEL